MSGRKRSNADDSSQDEGHIQKRQIIKEAVNRMKAKLGLGTKIPYKEVLRIRKEHHARKEETDPALWNAEQRIINEYYAQREETLMEEIWDMKIDLACEQQCENENRNGGAGGSSDPPAIPDQMELNDSNGSGEEEKDEGDDKKVKKYVPPKITAVHYDEDEDDQGTKKIEKARRCALQTSLIQEVKQQYSDAPVEHKKVSQRKREIDKPRDEFEEDNLVSMRVTRSSKVRAAKTTRDLEDILIFQNCKMRREDGDAVSTKRKMGLAGGSVVTRAKAREAKMMRDLEDRLIFGKNKTGGEDGEALSTKRKMGSDGGSAVTRAKARKAKMMRDLEDRLIFGKCKMRREDGEALSIKRKMGSAGGPAATRAKAREAKMMRDLEDRLIFGKCKTRGEDGQAVSTKRKMGSAGGPAEKKTKLSRFDKKKIQKAKGKNKQKRIK